MARPTKSPLESLRRFFRRVFAPPLLELSRTGKILQTLWDASQIQAQQREAYRKIGEIAAQMAKDGKLQNIRIERILAKIQQHERILNRQDLLLRNYQRRDREVKIRATDTRAFASENSTEIDAQKLAEKITGERSEPI